MGRKRFYDAVRDLIRDVHDPPEQPSRSRRRLSISSLLAAPQTCAACWDPVPTEGSLFSCNNCLGAFCPDCLAQYARSAITDRQLLPLKCADQSCRAPVALSALHDLLTPEEIARLSRYQCEMLRQPEPHVEPSMESASSNAGVDDEDSALASLMGTMGWRRCPDCGTGIERTQGCPHMVCVCGGEFCYSCGERWRGGGLGCPRRCGLPMYTDPLYYLLPGRFEELRDDVWQRIEVLLERVRDQLERGPNLDRLETVHCERLQISPPAAPQNRMTTRSASRLGEARPAQMRLRSLVHPSRENAL